MRCKKAPPPDIKTQQKGIIAGRRQTVNVLFFFAAVIVIFTALTLLTNTKTIAIDDRSKLSGFDFSASVAYISADCFDWYSEAFYTPDDFASNVTKLPQPIKRSPEQYGTYRLVLDNLVPGKVYGLSGYSATYAQKVWVDSVLLSVVGTPGESAKTTTPKTNYFTIYFTAESKQAEIIIWRADFVHAAGGQLYSLYFGEQALILQLNNRIYLRGAVVIGCMLMTALFFFGIFLFFKNRRHFLWFSLSCLLITTRTLSTDHKLIMTLFPDLNWYLSHKLEYLATLSLLFFFFLYLNRMFDRKIHRYINICGTIIIGMCFIMILITPSIVYTRFLPYMQYGILIYALTVIFVLVYTMVKERSSGHMEHILILLGTLGYVAFYFLDLVRYMRYDDLNLTQVGMVVFVFANTLALALNFTRTETALEEARVIEQEMTETNQMLERLNLLKSDFLANISHEMKTPLMVMSGYAQLTEWQLNAGEMSGITKENLRTISLEAQRLSRLVSQILGASSKEDGVTGNVCVRAEAILDRAAAMCEPILAKKNNRLESRVESDGLCVCTNPDMILQVLLNLIVNANRHVEADTVTLTVRRTGDMAMFCVKDNGTGIDAKLLNHVFERGKSGDGKTGLGLAICKDVVEAHGGRIDIESAPGCGTSVTFTMPVSEEEGK